jgi:N5-(cytidine 5'-diphosphoramidyl)-L-glutamine hydrolase
MKIAISQREEAIGMNGLIHDCLEQGWYTFLNKHEIIPIPNVNIDCDYDFDMLILSGGNTSLARLHTELKLYNCAIDKGLPIVGICHGAFFIAEITGGTCGDIDGHRDSEHVVAMEGHNVLVNSFHGSNIITVGKDYDAIALDLDGNIEGFKHKTKPIWGLIWHPERMEVPVLPKELDDLLGITKNVFNHIPSWIDEI